MREHVTPHPSIRDLRSWHARHAAPVAPPAPVEAEPVSEPDPDYGTMYKSGVVAVAEARGIDSTGTKADIIARLLNG